MIRNIIFDLFGVIARFDTEGYYTVHGISPSDQQILHARYSAPSNLLWEIAAPFQRKKP